jgi:hypothetical protein
MQGLGSPMVVTCNHKETHHLQAETCVTVGCSQRIKGTARPQASDSCECSSSKLQFMPIVHYSQRTASPKQVCVCNGHPAVSHVLFVKQAVTY